jgi:hypothetical protein
MNKLPLFIVAAILLFLLAQDPYRSVEITIERVMNKLEDFARAIRDFEGWFPGSVSQRNNNPGNLKAAGQYGVVGQDSQGHAIFDSLENGWNALLNQLQMALDGRSRFYHPDMSFHQFFNVYAEANSEPYAQFVASRLGVTPEATLRETFIG